MTFVLKKKNPIVTTNKNNEPLVYSKNKLKLLFHMVFVFLYKGTKILSGIILKGGRFILEG